MQITASGSLELNSGLPFTVPVQDPAVHVSADDFSPFWDKVFFCRNCDYTLITTSRTYSSDGSQTMLVSLGWEAALQSPGLGHDAAVVGVQGASQVAWMFIPVNGPVPIDSPFHTPSLQVSDPCIAIAGFPSAFWIGYIWLELCFCSRNNWQRREYVHPDNLNGRWGSIVPCRS